MEVRNYGRPLVEIAEQPVETYRMRYDTECRINCPITGVNSTADNRTYPSIRVTGHIGPAKIQVSCVTKDTPYRPHPFKLVGEHCGNSGVLTIYQNITADHRVVQLQCGIQRVRRGKAATSLQLREGLRVDPFGNGFDPESISNTDMKYVRLAIQVLVTDVRGHYRTLGVVVSNPISHEQKQLEICDSSQASGSARGGTKVILLMKKFQLPRRAVMVVRFEEPGTDWRAEVPTVTHNLFALTFFTPPYRDPDVKDPVQVEYYLRRTPTGDEVMDSHSTSDPLPFEYWPEPTSPKPPSKRQRTAEKSLHLVLRDQIKEPSVPGIVATQPQSPLSQFISNNVDWAETDEALIKDLFNTSQASNDNLIISTIGQPSPVGQQIYTTGQSFSIGQPFPVGQPINTCRQPISMLQPSPISQLTYTTGQPSSIRQPSPVGRQISTSGQSSSMGQPSPVGRQISTPGQSFSMGQPSLVRRQISTTGQPSLMGQPSPVGRQISTPGQSFSMGQPSLVGRQISTTGQPSLMGQPSLVGRQISTPEQYSSMGQPSPVGQQISTPEQYSSMRQPSPVGRQTSTPEQHSSINMPIRPSIARNPASQSYSGWRSTDSLLDSPCPNYILDQPLSSGVYSWPDSPCPNYMLDQPHGSGHGVQIGQIPSEFSAPMQLLDLQQSQNDQQVTRAASTEFDSDILQLDNDDGLNPEEVNFIFEYSDAISDFYKLSTS